MLRNTFCHIPGVGTKTERNLWDRGFLSWDSALSGTGTIDRRFPYLKNVIEESFSNLERRDPNYFSSRLSAREHWRLFPDFRSDIAYLDIETNGYVGEYGYITAITLYDGESIYNYIRGENLDKFKKDIQKYKVLVTYNGKCFDIPFIETHMRTKLGHAHIDLRYILRELGFKGGLKGCEKTVGITRGVLDGIDGYFAVLLWNDYVRNKNPKALETLLAYNVQDVVNLEPLLAMAYNLKLRGTPFIESHHIPRPEAPASSYSPDAETIERINWENRHRLSFKAHHPRP